MRTPTPIAALAGLTLLINSALAVAPANDDFAAAADLGTTSSTTVAGSTIDATEEFGEPNPEANPGIEPFATAWWKFAVPADGFVEVSTVGSDFDTVLAVFTGSDLFTLAEAASDNDGGAGTTSKLTFSAVAGITYHIQVSGANLEQGTVSLAISPGTAPTPPVLSSVTLLPSPIDVTTVAGMVTARLQIDSPDGFDYGQLGVFDPADVATGAGGFFDESARVSGDEFSGSYEIPLAISTYSPPGTYRIDLSLLESNGDSAAYGLGAQAWPSGSTGTFEVVNNGTVDNTPPAIASLSFTPDNVDVTSAAANLAVTVQASDDLGIQYLSIDVYDPDNFYLFSALASLASGTITSGTWQSNVPVARGSTPGIWRLDVRAIDFSAKTTSYTPTATEDEFTVVNNGTVDEDPPTLVNLSFSPNPVVRGNQVTVSIEFADNLSGLAAIPSNLYLDFYDATGALQFSDPFSLADLFSGTATAGTLQYPTTIQATAPTGIWDTEIDLQDGAGSRASYGNLNPGGSAFPYPAGVSGQLVVLATGGTAYEIWIARYPSLTGPDAAPLADPDGDGWPNLLELPFDGDPTVALPQDPNAANFPAPQMTATEFKLRFSLVDTNLNGTQGSPIEVRGMMSSDLRNWNEMPITDLGGGAYEVAVSSTTAARRFLHIDVRDPN